LQKLKHQKRVYKLSK